MKIGLIDFDGKIPKKYQTKNKEKNMKKVIKQQGYGLGAGLNMKHGLQKNYRKTER